MSTDANNKPSGEELPPVLNELYHKYQYISEANEVIKLRASCKKCAKVIQCAWKPVRVTSNFNSHAKVCRLIIFVYIYRISLIYKKL